MNQSGETRTVVVVTIADLLLSNTFFCIRDLSLFPSLLVLEGLSYQHEDY